MAGIAAGGGAVYTAVKSTGKWTVRKVLAEVGKAAVAAGTAAAADSLAEAGLRKLGASEQTIRGAKLAAAIVGAILIHKAAKRGGTPTAATEGSSPESVVLAASRRARAEWHATA